MPQSVPSTPVRSSSTRRGAGCLRRATRDCQPARWPTRRGCHQPAALPLRVQTGPHPGAAGGGEPAAPGRQNRLYAEETPLWQRYEHACDYLEDDLDSGYVRVLQEMIAAGWSNKELGNAVRELLNGWFALLADVARETEHRHGPLGPFTAEEVGMLIGSAFFGSEALLLLGFDRELPADPRVAAADRRH